MAKFELIPDLTIMGIQGAIFGAAYFVVKTQFVAPYLKLKDKRLSLTEGNEGSARALVVECNEKTEVIEAKVAKTIEETKIFREAEKTKATESRDEIISKASKEAREEVERLSAHLAKMLQEEKAKIPEVVKKLNDELYNMAIN